MAKKDYTESDIQVLTDREHVRLRLPVYAGNTSPNEYSIPMFVGDRFVVQNVTFIPAALKCVNEIIDNSNDELIQSTSKDKTITIDANTVLGLYTISDNGRGVPIGKHASGKYTPEVVFGSLRSGRNFTDDKTAGVIGMNGMGSAITCMVSTEFSIDIQRDGKRYRQTFTDGGLHVTKPSIRSYSGKQTGTTISFQLDPEVFSDITLPDELLENRAMEIALTNPGVTTTYNKKKFRFKKGFDDVIRKISNDYFKFTAEGVEFYVIFDVHEGVDEQIFSWVNSSLLFDGGICNTQFLNAFYDKTVKHLTPLAKKQKCEVTKNDVRANLLVLGNLSVEKPEYDAQSKTRLTGPNLRKEFVDMLDEQWSTFTRKNKQWINTVLERAVERHHKVATKQAIKEHQKNKNKKVPGLNDATSANRYQCQILLSEGDSAASMITDARDPKTTASLPLRGKVNNVYGCTIAQLLNMGKISDMLSAIGLVPGQKAIRSTLRYGKIVIATDADHDGDDIFALLVNLFYTFWPELFDPEYEPIVYRLVAPNVCAVKGNKRIHFPTRSEYEKQKHKYSSGWTIKYFKGLGSMSKVDWEMILTGETDTLIPIVDDGKMKETLQLLFGNDTSARKQWLQQPTGTCDGN